MDKNRERIGATTIAELDLVVDRVNEYGIDDRLVSWLLADLVDSRNDDRAVIAQEKATTRSYEPIARWRKFGRDRVCPCCGDDASYPNNGEFPECRTCEAFQCEDFLRDSCCLLYDLL